MDEMLQELNRIEVMWHEKIEFKARHEGMMKGLAEGMESGLHDGAKYGVVQGLQKMLLQLLTKKFGPLPGAIINQIRMVGDDAALIALSEQLLTAASLEEIVVPEKKSTNVSAMKSDVIIRPVMVVVVSGDNINYAHTQIRGEGFRDMMIHVNFED